MTDRDLEAVMGMVGSIRPFAGKHRETGESISVMVSPDYVTIKTGNVNWHFFRDTGAYDGYSTEEKHGL